MGLMENPLIAANVARHQASKQRQATEEKEQRFLAARDESVAAAAGPTQFSNAFTLSMMSAGEMSAGESTLAAMSAKVQSGDLSDLEAMLTEQVFLMNNRMGSYLLQANRETAPDAQARLMGVALRCQEGCRKTVHTLNEMKNPKRTTFIKQQLNQLIQEAQTDGGKAMDPRATAIAGSEDPAMETVATVHRATVSRGKGQGKSKRTKKRSV